MNSTTFEQPTDVPESASVRLPRPVVQKAAIIAQHRGITIGKYVADMIEARVSDDYREVVRELSAELGNPIA